MFPSNNLLKRAEGVEISEEFSIHFLFEGQERGGDGVGECMSGGGQRSGPNSVDSVTRMMSC